MEKHDCAGGLGRFGVHEAYLNAGAAIEIKMGQGQSRELAAICRERKLSGMFLRHG